MPIQATKIDSFLKIRLVEKYGFKRGLEMWNRVLCSPFVVTRQVQLIRFLPEYERSNEKSLQWQSVFSIRPHEIVVTRQKSLRFILTTN
jgi:hypothetical protein